MSILRAGMKVVTRPCFAIQPIATGMRSHLGALSAWLLLASSVFVSAVPLGVPTTVGFDDCILTDWAWPPNVLGSDGQPYCGFQWMDFACANSVGDIAFAESFANGAVTSSHVLSNYGGANARFSWIRPFDLNSAYLTAVGVDELDIQVLGFRQGDLVYDTTVRVNGSSPTLFCFDYLDVSFVQFNANSTRFVLDDMTLTLSVPDAGSSSLILIASLTALLALRRRLPGRH
jgi:hypothetical protein